MGAAIYKRSNRNCYNNVQYNKNYKLTISATNDQADDSSDYFANIFSNNNEFENDELEDYLRKPITPFKTDPLQWWKVAIFFIFNVI